MGVVVNVVVSNSGTVDSAWFDETEASNRAKELGNEYKAVQVETEDEEAE